MRYIKERFLFDFVLDQATIRCDVSTVDQSRPILGSLHFGSIEQYEEFKDEMQLLLVPDMNEVVG